MLIAMRPAVTVRGSLFLIKYKFVGDKIPRPKFCVLMENYVKGKGDFAVVFTTKNLRYRDCRSSVFVAGGVVKGLDLDTLIECENWALIPCQYILKNEEVEYQCQLPSSIMASVNDALLYVRHIHETILARMIE